MVARVYGRSEALRSFLNEQNVQIVAPTLQKIGDVILLLLCSEYN